MAVAGVLPGALPSLLPAEAEAMLAGVSQIGLGPLSNLVLSQKTHWMTHKQPTHQHIQSIIALLSRKADAEVMVVAVLMTAVCDYGAATVAHLEVFGLVIQPDEKDSRKCNIVIKL